MTWLMLAKSNRKKGLSLMEFLIVFFIIGLVAAMAIPALSNFYPYWRSTNNATIVATKLRAAQEASVTTQKTHILRFNPSESPPTIQTILYDNGEEGGETVLETKALDVGVTLTLDSSITNNQVIFASDGAPTGNGNVNVIYSGRTRTINISAAGVIKQTN